MAQHLVERAEDLRPLRHQHDGPAPRGQHRPDVAQRADVIVYMLDHVEADHRVEAALGARKGLATGHVGERDVEVGAVGGQPLQRLQVERVDVRGDVLVARDQPAGQVAGARADLEDALAAEGEDGIGHPGVEAWGPPQAAEDLRAPGVLLVDAVGPPEAQDGEERAEAVAPADLLPLLVGAPRVADGHLEDARPALGQLDGQLRLEPEVVGDQGDGAEQRGADRLVAGLHVGKVHVGHQVGEEREQPVAQLVAEEQGPARLAAGEAGAEDGVGLLLDEDRQEAEQVARVVLEVGVVDHGEFAVGALQPGPDGRPLAAVASLLQEEPVGGAGAAGAALQHLDGPGAARGGGQGGGQRDAAGGGEGRQNRRGAVARGVVDHHHLQARQVRALLQHLQPLQRGGHQVLLVEDGNQDGEGGHDGSQRCRKSAARMPRKSESATTMKARSRILRFRRWSRDSGGRPEWACERGDTP